MKLFTNGCSWTYGGGLDLDQPYQEAERLKVVWPHHLGKLLNTDQVVNLAMGCGSNQRMIRTTFDWLLTQTKQELADTIAVIQFTEPSRFEINYENDWYNCKIGCVTFGDNRVANTHEENFKVQEMYSLVESRFVTYSDVEGDYSLLSSATSIDNLFKQFHLKDWYFWSFSNDFMRSKYKEYYCNNFKIVDKQYMTDLWKYSRVGIKFFNQEFDPHPSIEGHRQVANALFHEMGTYK